MTNRTLIIVALILLTIGPAGLTQAEMLPANKSRAGVPPFQIIKEIIQHNQKTTAKATIHPARTDQNHIPYLTWLADSDDRVQPQLILPEAQGKIYTVRNLANQFGLSTGAIDFGVLHLLTPVLLITGNTDNLAIRLFMEGYLDLEPEIRQELDHLHLPLVGVRQESGAEATSTFEEQLLSNIEKNVDYQVEQASWRYKERVQTGRLIIVGGVIDLGNLYGHGPDRLVIINVNNDKDADSIRRIQAISTINPKFIEIIGRQKPQPVEKKEKK